MHTDKFPATGSEAQVKQSPQRPPLCVGKLEECAVHVCALCLPLPTSLWSRLPGLVPRGADGERGRKEQSGNDSLGVSTWWGSPKKEKAENMCESREQRHTR